jgi:hypothetical protein
MLRDIRVLPLSAYERIAQMEEGAAALGYRAGRLIAGRVRR